MRFLVISAGPGAIFWQSVLDIMKNQSAEPIYIATVKNAVSLYPESDYHFVNNANLKKFSNLTAKKIMLRNPESYYFGKYDHIYTLSGHYHETNFEKFKEQLNMNIDTEFRPMGYGIMVEIVIPYLVSLGAKEIITVGWDIGAPDGLNKQFDHSEPVLKRQLKLMKFKKIIKALAPDKFTNLLRYTIYLKNLIAFHTGRVIFRGAQSLSESREISNKIEHVGDYCSENGVQLKIYSNSVWMKNQYAESIPE